MKVVLHPGAERDVAEAAAFYASEASPALAGRFVAEIDRVARLLLDNPGLGTRRSRDRRGFPMPGFPYTVIYKGTSDGIVILVVKHDRRRPGHGAGRTP